MVEKSSGYRGVILRRWVSLILLYRVADLLWNGWQLSRGMGGRLRLESVAAFVWNTQIEHGADPNKRDRIGLNSLIHAALSGCNDAVNYLLNLNIPVDCTDYNGWTPLFWTVIYNRQSTIEILLKKGADPNKEDINGWTPLIHAKLRKYDKIINLLQLYS